ncbi:MAG: cytidylate kinase family protein [Deltaproteobacteria bacterium]|nr:cytidylate kinase family protein [Deltaproteobacteria bacterium]MBW1960645.1 cytidylate kinase family protein [Deltaproteobacteria bacterium]MBW1995874.1 cytidylate kinase family protein [Deltaproteobacteria bacterium]MBW2150651.1 cytidylate kinase family protein [Deltaproteobacteria bacterium]
MHFITLSRQLGSNGTEIARQVAQKLEYAFIDTEAIDRRAKEMGLLESVSEMDEKTPSLFQRIFTHRPAINLARLNSVIFELTKQGDAVFVGRGGHMLLRNFDCALHVRVVASRKRRIKNLVNRGYDEKSAEEAIANSDRERSGFMKFAFGVDWENSQLYDLVLNMDKLGIGSAVDTIVSLARSGEIKACSLTALETLENQALVARVEAAITEAGLSYGPGTSVFVSVDRPGRVRLSGIVEDEQSKVRAEEVVKRVNGVEAVENEIRIARLDRHA